MRASGVAGGAGSVSTALDGSPVSATLLNGNWFADLALSPGNHALSAAAYYPAGQFSYSTTNRFTVLSTNNVVDQYDAAGYVTNRMFANGKMQALVWDAAGRLVGLTQWDNPTNGFFWTAIYDPAGRRVRTIQVPVVNGYTNVVRTLTEDAYFDPEVEFEEVGVGVNGRRTWEVLGPDLDGAYGSFQGVGGLEATVRESDGATTPVLNDYFGNVLASVSGGSTSWNSVRVGGYGPEAGYHASALTAGTSLADTLVWRSRRMDPSGFYHLGAREYDPLAGHFLSADPLGHAGSMDLYSFCLGDPVNRFDPTGQFGKAAYQDAQAGAAALADGYNGDHMYGSLLGTTGGNAYETLYGAGAVGKVVSDVLVQAGVVVLTDGLGELGVVGEEGLLAEEGMIAGEGEGAAITKESPFVFGEGGQGEFAFARQTEAAPAAVGVEETATEEAIGSEVAGASRTVMDEVSGSSAMAEEANVGALRSQQLELSSANAAAESPQQLDLIKQDSIGRWWGVRGNSGQMRPIGGIEPNFSNFEQQNHHLISNPIVDALEGIGIQKETALALRDNPALQYTSSPGGHIGYESWHRAYDAYMVDYIRAKGPQGFRFSDFFEEIDKYYRSGEPARRIPGVNLGQPQ